MVAPLIIGGIALASIIGPPIIQWIGDQTWNKSNFDAQQKMAAAAEYDMKQRQLAEQYGFNPYLPNGGNNSTTNATSDPFGSMMPMMMMMMMIPMMTNLMQSKKGDASIGEE